MATIINDLEFHHLVNLIWFFLSLTWNNPAELVILGHTGGNVFQLLVNLWQKIPTESSHKPGKTL